jgi:hypothetical protein
MAGLVPAIHDFDRVEAKTWMPGIKPGMTIPDRSRFPPMFTPLH